MMTWTRALAALLLATVASAAAAAGLPPHWQQGAFMEIFVRAYADSDGDGIGDLRGLTAKLPYLKDLGITGLWLMPVTASADRDHGYAPIDDRRIEPDYGTLADFDALLRRARQLGIGIVTDAVLNHASAEHPAFVAARADAASPWRRWFVWSPTAPEGWDIWGKNPWYAASAEPWTFRGDLKTLQPAPGDPLGYYFGTFGPHMPDFDLRNPEVVAHHEASLRFWLDRGLAGFRLDATPHLIENDAVRWNDQPESRALTRRFADLIRAYPGRYVVCEATAEPRAWADPAVCGAAFAFGHVHHLVRAAKGDADSVRALAEYWQTAPPTMATFVSNHDRFAGDRLWDQVGGDERRYRLAAAGYLLQPGTPFVYYGEEVGQAGVPGLPGDQPLRAPMSWSGDSRTAGFTRGTPFRPPAPNVATHNVRRQRADPGSILNFYRALLRLRAARPSIARGGYEHAAADGLVLAFQRRLGHERTLVLINYGEQPATVRPPGLPPGTRLRALLPRGAPASTAAALTLPPLSLRVYALR